MEKSNKLKCTEGTGGGKGSGIREADSDDRGFPLKQIIQGNVNINSIFM
jgi:hypothetical protein